jgi:TRAP-type C4-dicarboxylate transport system permease small subunit
MERIVFPIAEIMHKIGLGILFLLMALTVGDVVGRYFLAAPIPGTFEVTNFMLALIVFLTLGYTQVQKGHIRIDILVARFSPRTQAILDAINYSLSLLLFSLVIWQTAMHAKRLWVGHNVSGILSWPIYPFVIFVAFGTLVFSLVLLVNLLGAIAKAVEQ